jgi:hypothetical protein
MLDKHDVVFRHEKNIPAHIVTDYKYNGEEFAGVGLNIGV